jgi:hypothetical protein
MNSSKPLHANLSQVWLKAAVAGGLWASIEIIIGSFFHNLRLPFAGTILAANSTTLMIAFYQIWPEKGLIWRAGIIAAVMKSVSPSAVILGPMTGIMSEALILELVIRLFGNNPLSLSLAGSLSVSSALIHKVVSLLILYGFNIVRLYLDIFKFLARQVKIENPDPWFVIFAVTGIYLGLGIAAAILGYRIGRKVKSHEMATGGILPLKNTQHPFLSFDPRQRFSLLLFFVHLVFIPAGLLLLNYTSLIYAFLFTLAYILVCSLRYKTSLRRLKKPAFWGQLFILTFLAAIFWNGVNSKGPLFETEGLLIGLEMNLRAIFVVIAFSSLGVELRNPVIRNYLFNRGFDKIYSAIGLSVTAMPVMIDAMPKPKVFLFHPFRSFSQMLLHAKQWLQVFEKN